MQTCITDERFKQLIEAGDYKTLQAELSSSPASELRKLAALSKTCLKKYNRMQGTEEQTTSAIVGAIHVYTIAELKQLKLLPMSISREHFDFDFIRAIPTDKLPTFIDLALENNSWLFDAIRRVDAEGLAKKPKTNAYVIALIQHYSWTNKNQDGLKAQLQNDKTFLDEDVWWLFEFEGTAETCLAGSDKYLTNANETWEAVLVTLSNEGFISREKLLDLSLQTQTREWNQFRLGWFMRFHEAMKPTLAEREQLLDKYKALLSSPIPPIVSSAIKAILDLTKANKVKYYSVSEFIGPALAAKSKSASLNALKILELLCKSEPSIKQDICVKSTEAIFTGIPEVQSKVFQLLDTHAKFNDRLLIDAFKQQSQAICPSVRNQIPKPLRDEHSKDETIDFTPPNTETEHSTESGAARNQTSAQASPRESSLIERKKLSPIGTLDDLVFEIARFLESPQDPCVYELLIDGISRLGLERMNDFSSRTSSILKRAKSIAKRTENAMLLYLTELIIFWVTGEYENLADIPERSWTHKESFDAPAKQSLQRIIGRLKRNVALPVLSTPEYEFGWLDKSTFLRRLAQYAEAKEDDSIDKQDVCRALMRCTFDEGQRVETIVEQIREISKSCSAKAQSEIEKAISILAEIEAFHTIGFSWEITTAKSHTYIYEVIRLTPHPLAVYEDRVMPGVMQQSISNFLFASVATNPLQITMHGIMAPRFPELHYAMAVQWLGDRLTFFEKNDQLTKQFFRTLFDPSRQITEMGLLMICLALGTNDNELTIAAKDAIIEIIEDGKADFDTFKTILRTLFHNSSSLILRRWASNYAEIAKASERHARLVFSLLDAVLQQAPESKPTTAHRDLPQLLQTFLEIKSEYNFELSTNCIEFLQSLKSSGKTKTLVKSLTE